MRKLLKFIYHKSYSRMDRVMLVIGLTLMLEGHANIGLLVYGASIIIELIILDYIKRTRNPIEVEALDFIIKQWNSKIKER